jgi:arabinose-5-phosphate isomerase
MLFRCEGRIITAGMGKSGHVARKAAATLSSTGSPSMFMHPAEAGHGDLGMLVPGDVLLMFSNSGTTAELQNLMPALKRLQIPILLICGKADSLLARDAEHVVVIEVEREACPLDLAPTASSIAMLAAADALAISLLEQRGFTRDDFARAHPGGQLGRRLLLRIRDIMHTGADIPVVNRDTTISTAIVEMTQKRLGMVAVIDHQHQVCGIFTDGDLRRSLEQQENLIGMKIDGLMSPAPLTIGPDALAVEAAALLQQHKVQALLVTDQQRLVGALNIHDLLQHGVL